MGFSVELGAVSEDRLFDDKVIRLIEWVHDVRVDKDSIRRRLRLCGYEVDVYFSAYTLNKHILRTFLIELKEHDLEKVILQAYKRSHLANYTYIVINHSTEYIVDYIIRRWKTLPRLIAESGIGIISYQKDLDIEPFLVRKAKYKNYTNITHYRQNTIKC